MKKLLFFSIFIFALVLIAPLGAQAQVNPFDISFPIPELGNCGSVDECSSYCESPANYNACGEWAAENGFIEDEALDSPQIPDAGGPGGCRSEVECHTYCSEPSNIEECVQFSRNAGHISQEEADRQLRGGPGGCRSQEECDAFCNNPQNGPQCIEFAVREGEISEAEAEKLLRGGPGGCRGARECENYCRQPGHQQECLKFAVDEGHITEAEAAQFSSSVQDRFRGPRDFGPGEFTPIDPGEPEIDEEKVRQLLEEIDGPGGCSTFNECEQYCSRPDTGDECFAFAIEHELIPAHDVERFRGLLDTEGPGGCRGRACEAHCNQPGNERECLEFAKKQGFISPQEAAEIERFIQATEQGGPGGCRGRECERYCEDPAHRDECFEFAKSSGIIPPEEIERIEKLQQLGRKVEQEGGPGGCRGENECMEYCSNLDHFDECAAFAVQEGFLSQDDAEHSLREFINVDQFGPQGFGPGGPGGFDGPGGFPGPQGFGPGGPGGFGPGDFENVPPEFRSQFEQEFNSRFDRFNQFQDHFEEGGPRPGGFPGPSGFPGGGDAGASGETHVILKQNPSGTITLEINDSDGIQEFFFKPQDGSHFSGGLSCDKNYRTETAIFGQMRYPLDSYVIDCGGDRYEFVVPSLGDFNSKRPQVSTTPPSRDDFLEQRGVPEGFTPDFGDGNFPRPEDFEQFRPGDFRDEFAPEGFNPEQFEQFFEGGEPQGFDGFPEGDFVRPEDFIEGSPDFHFEEGFTPDSSGFDIQHQIENQIINQEAESIEDSFVNQEFQRIEDEIRRQEEERIHQQFIDQQIQGSFDGGGSIPPSGSFPSPSDFPSFDSFDDSVPHDAPSSYVPPRSSLLGNLLQLLRGFGFGR